MQTRRLFVLEITARSDPEAISPNLLRFRRRLMRQYIDSPAFEADSSCPWGEPVAVLAILGYCVADWRV